MEEYILKDDSKGLVKFLQNMYTIAEKNNSKRCMEVLDDFMLNDDEELIEGMMESPGLKQNSKNVYKRKLEIIVNDIFDGTRTLKYILLHPKEFKEKIDLYTDTKKDITALSMWKNMFYTALLGIYNHNESFQRNHYKTFEELKELQSNVKKPIDEKYISNVPSDKQNNAYVEFSKLKEIYNNLKKGSNPRLLLGLYIHIPPVRSDYANCRILKDVPDNEIKGNYVVITNNNPYIMMQDFKTAKKYGSIKIPIPKVLLNDIKDSLEINERDYLFVSERNGKPYNTLKDGEKAFNKFANRLLSKHVKKGFTLTSFRHSYLSSIDLSKMSTKEKTELGRIMGHARSTQEEYVYSIE
jgi:hypothetical protein